MTVLDSQGKVVSESKIRTEAETIRSAISRLAGTMHVTLEEGTQSAWLYELISPLVAELIVCDPRADYITVNGKVCRVSRPTGTRGLNRNYNRRMKAVFKSAARYASHKLPFKQLLRSPNSQGQAQGDGPVGVGPQNLSDHFCRFGSQG